jgi:2'-5' RNA ligase
MPGEGRPRRLFVAVEVPPEVRAALEAALAPWREALPAARWVPPQHLHVTLRFLGGVRPDLVDGVSAAVGAAARTVAPVVTRLDGLGAFPTPGRARVLWAGLEDGPGRMAGLALAIDTALAPTFRPEARPFRPHLTVARCDPPARLPPSFASTPLEPVAFEVARAVLFESVPTGTGPPRYEVVAAHPLAG